MSSYFSNDVDNDLLIISGGWDKKVIISYINNSTVKF